LLVMCGFVLRIVKLLSHWLAGTLHAYTVTWSRLTAVDLPSDHGDISTLAKYKKNASKHTEKLCYCFDQSPPMLPDFPLTAHLSTFLLPLPQLFVCILPIGSFLLFYISGGRMAVSQQRHWC